MSEQYIGLLDAGWPDDDDTALVRRRLTGLAGPVLDLGCGPGHWTGYLHSLGADVTGIDPVPEFIAYAQSTYRGPVFRLGSLTGTNAVNGAVGGSAPAGDQGNSTPGAVAKQVTVRVDVSALSDAVVRIDWFDVLTAGSSPPLLPHGVSVGDVEVGAASGGGWVVILVAGDVNLDGTQRGETVLLVVRLGLEPETAVMLQPACHVSG